MAVVTWDGGGDGTRWHDAANWVGDALPSVGDDAAVPPEFAAATVAIDSNALVRSIESSAALALSGATLTIDTITAPELAVTSNAALTTFAATAMEVHKLELNIAGTLFVEEGSRIDVSGKGYLPGRTTGNTELEGAALGSGGSYGGLGGDMGGGIANRVYDDYAEPDDWGSGGSPYPGQSTGGSAGGGLMTIRAIMLELDGELLANDGPSLGRGGGGSGGSIYVAVETLSGDGMMQAAGGNGKASGTSTTVFSGAGGGGGRIAVHARDLTSFDTGHIAAPGGRVPMAGNSPPTGGAGTVFVKDRDATKGTLIIDGIAGGTGWTPLGLPEIATFELPDAVIIRGARTHVKPEHAGLVLQFQNSLLVAQSAEVQIHADEFQPLMPVSLETGAKMTIAGDFAPTIPLSVSGEARIEVAGNMQLDVPLSLTSDGTLQVLGTVTSSLPLVVDGGQVIATRIDASDVSVTTEGSLRVFASLICSLSLPVDDGRVDAQYIESPEVSVANGGSIQVVDTLAASLSLVVDRGQLIGTRFEAPELSLVNGGRITTFDATATEAYKLELNITGTLLVDSTSSIDVSGKGYSSGRTTGNATDGAATGNSAGSYGGLGSGAAPNRTYGDYADPNDWGSGGVNGAGGGLVRLRAEALTLDGQIVALPQTGFNSGAGSGGGVYVEVATLSGIGQIQARGAQGASGSGGGRIAVYAEDFTGFPLANISAPGRSGAGDGTVHIVQGRPLTRVRSHSPAGRNDGHVAGAIEFVDLEFSRPIEIATLNTENVLIQGPRGAIVPTGFELIGENVYRVSFPRQEQNGRYHFTLLPGILDADGIAIDQNANGIPGEFTPSGLTHVVRTTEALAPTDLYEFTLTLDTVPPRVAAHLPAGDVAGTLASIDIVFSEAIDNRTLSTADVSLAGPSGNIAVAAITPNGLNRYRVAFAPQTETGGDSLNVRPDIADLAGNPLMPAYSASINLVEVDLYLDSVTVNANQLWAGEPVTVHWTGANRTGEELVGNWIDAVYLSSDPFWDIHDIPLGRLEHRDGLPKGQPYFGTLTVPTPGLLPGNYHVIVRTDVANNARELNEADNLFATPAFPLLVRPLADNTVNGRLTSADRADYYVIDVRGGDSVRLTLNIATPEARAGLYSSYAAIPTLGNFEHRSSTPTAQQAIAFTGIASGGKYYVLVHGDQLPGDVEYTLVAETAPFHVASVSPRRHGDAIPALVTITGTGFDETVEVLLVDQNGRWYEQQEVHLSSTAIKLPSVSDLLPGVYAMRVTKGARTVELPGAFEVVEGGEARLETNLVIPGAMSPGFPNKQTLWVEYRNAGDVAMPAPLLQIVANAGSNGLLTTDEALANAMLQSRTRPIGLGASVQLLAIGSSASPDILQPGESGRLPIWYVGQTRDDQQRAISFSLGSLTTLDTTEKACYVQNPPERLVYERPRHGGYIVDVNEGVWPFHAVRRDANSPGVGLVASSNGSVGPSNILIGPPNCFEEFLTVDWFSILDNARPESFPVDAWQSVVYTLRTKNDEVNDFWASYVREMAENANYLGEVGQVTSNVGALWSMEVAQGAAAINPIRYLAGDVDMYVPAPGLPLTFSRVYGQSLPSRFRTGPLGRGWTHNWDIRAERQDDGVLLRGPAGVDRFFTRNSNGSYSAGRGDFGRLTEQNDALRLTEADGTIWQFHAISGLLEYVEDSNGNRITLSYSEGRLDRLTHSNGRARHAYRLSTLISR